MKNTQSPPPPSKKFSFNDLLKKGKNLKPHFDELKSPPSLQDRSEKESEWVQISFWTDNGGDVSKAIHSVKNAHFEDWVTSKKDIISLSRHQYTEELKGEIEGMKIEWVEGKLTDREKIRLKNMVNGALDKVLSLLERKGEQE